MLLAALATILIVLPTAIGMGLVGGFVGWYRVAIVVVGLPYLALLGGVFFVHPRTGGGLALAAGGIGAALLGVGFLVAAWRIGPVRELSALAAYLLLAPVQVVGAILAQIVLVRGGLALRKGRTLQGGRGVTIALAAIVAFAGLQTVESLKRAWVQGRALAASKTFTFSLTPKQSARGDIYEALACLARYTNEHGEYPETLLAIGPQGSKCLSEASTAPIPGYVTHYEPRKTAENGHFDTFSLRYEPAGTQDRAEAFFQTDETGLVYSGVDANGRPQYPIQNNTGTLGYMTAGVEYFRLLGGTYSYPQTLQEETPARSIDHFKQFHLAPERDDPKRAGRLDGYRFLYTPGPVDGSGRILTYRFDARPVVYGREYRKSYMCESTGRFHATDEDRAAEVEDPDPLFDAALKEDRPGPCKTFEQVRLEHAQYLTRQRAKAGEGRD